MDKFFRQKILAAILFLAYLFIFSFLNIRAAWGPMQYSFALFREQGVHRSSAAELETVINASVYQKYRYIEAFGYLQRLMDKNEQSDFETVKDNSGMLHETRFATGPVDTFKFAGKLWDLRNNIGRDIPILYLMTPDKYIRGSTVFPTGIPYNYANETADGFLRMLSLYNVGAVDLRERISGSGIPPEELFYKTDSRWKIESNFWAFTELVTLLNEQYGTNLDKGNFFANPDNYNRITYPASHLGELGKKAGKYYARGDDFTIIYPKFDTDYTIRMGYDRLDEYTMEGRFEDTLLSAMPFHSSENTRDVQADKYSSYLLVNRGVAHIRNNNNPGGVKIAFINDSMITPMAGFLSAACSDIYMIDPVYYSGDISEFLGNVQLDILIVSFSPQNLNDTYFSF